MPDISNLALAMRVDELLTRTDLLLLGRVLVASQVYQTATADADPGAGNFRLNNATLSNVTAGYFDNAAFDGTSLAALFDTYDDSTSATKGTLTLQSNETPSNWANFRITGAVVDGTGYRKLTLVHITSNGTWTADERFSQAFYRAGDKGDTSTYAGTSTSSVAIGASGAKTFATQAGLAYQVGTRVRAASVADPAVFMEGVVSAYASTTLTFTADYAAGSGTIANWTLSVTGDGGPAAAAAAASATAAAASATTASGAATTATTQAGIATTKASEASAAADAAEAALAAAETAETNAETAATSATASASTAITQSGIATTQAGLATTARVAAETAETNAETAETNAETAAAASETSRVASVAAKTAAEAARDAALTAETNAETAETNAEAALAAVEAIREITWRGAYNSATSYLVADGVSYSGVAYIAIEASTNQQPDISPTKWAPIGTLGTGDMVAADRIETNAGAADSNTKVFSVTAAKTHVAGAVSDHAAASDPHPGYTTAAELAAAIAGLADEADLTALAARVSKIDSAAPSIEFLWRARNGF